MASVRAFYDALFAPLVERHGPLDAATLTAIVGFDAGGPISLCTIGRDRRARLITYVTCELAVRPEQVESGFGRCTNFSRLRKTSAGLTRS